MKWTSALVFGTLAGCAPTYVAQPAKFADPTRIPEKIGPNIFDLWKRCAETAFQKARLNTPDKSVAAEVAFQACATEEQTAFALARMVQIDPLLIAAFKLRMKNNLIALP